LKHSGISLTRMDFEAALGKARASYSQSMGAPTIPNVAWDDVGGLSHVKSDIMDTLQLPLDHPELFANGLKKRSGNGPHIYYLQTLTSFSDQAFSCTDLREQERRCWRKLWQLLSL
jgi:hypothetical protein